MTYYDCRCNPPREPDHPDTWPCEHGMWVRDYHDPPLPGGGRTWRKVTRPDDSPVEQPGLLLEGSR